MIRTFRIVSDGTAAGTGITDADSGIDVTDVLRASSITWRVSSGELATASLEIDLMPLEVLAQWDDKYLRSYIFELQALLAARVPAKA